ncbi:hypothetical protein BDZ90DRAFT_171301 [Jaminaea rosea]|uniref:Uncharacterized protein n=1 Tax=Jaminaea rosea TaxID=1569628 RepID=A0A316UTW3_9BASI|nr:hypothetical protein BDZ90DRAFT_171301 [Jaminaea rosea]PWN27761.1 hypothetical protein BDZ90DRAFT_171301 [Jaminaea rosea]
MSAASQPAVEMLSQTSRGAHPPSCVLVLSSFPIGPAYTMARIPFTYTFIYKGKDYTHLVRFEGDPTPAAVDAMPADERKKMKDKYWQRVKAAKKDIEAEEAEERVAKRAHKEANAIEGHLPRPKAPKEDAEAKRARLAAVEASLPPGLSARAVKQAKDDSTKARREEALGEEGRRQLGESKAVFQQLFHNDSRDGRPERRIDNNRRSLERKGREGRAAQRHGRDEREGYSRDNRSCSDRTAICSKLPYA